ncbi:transposase, partial [Snuella lapsa]|uniref:transposase n=1 Tax=Snuella lapsa TaxID=870481 RepID=UPI0031EA8E5A
NPMYQVLSKDMIELEIVPYLPETKRGFKPKVPLCEIVNAILYKLKTGIQWEFLPVESLFERDILHYKTVFGHYRKWCELDVWKSCWIELLKANKSKLDLSSGDLDGSHTTALRGGQEVGYQGRKKRKTTNAIYLTDRQGLPISMSEPVSGNHNDLFDIEVQFEEVVGTLEDAEISIDGLFINADAGFDSQKLRDKCEAKGIIANICPNKRNGNNDVDYYFDEKLYEERYAIERTNAWMDSFRSLLNRFDTTLTSWKG